MAIKLTSKHKIKLLNSNDVYRVMQDILLREDKIDQEKEHFWMIGLALNNGLQYIEQVSMGSVKSTLVEPMNVFRIAVMKGSVSVIIVHNHPSGELKPSADDKDVTDRLIQVGRILNISVIDHLIITKNSFLSFTDFGLIEELKQSTKWVPQFELIERIRKEEKKIRLEMVKIASKESLEKGLKTGKKEGLKEGEKKKAIEIALNALKKGLSIDVIIELTGLTKKEIEAL